MSAGKSPAVNAALSPRLNGLLGALPQEDLDRLLPQLEPVPLPAGATIHGAGEKEKYLYFPASGIVSRFYVMECGASAGFSLIGNEGAIGVALFLGAQSTPSQAVVLSPGYAYRLSAKRLLAEVDRHDALVMLLLRYIQALITQIGQVSACNRHHSTEQRLCRWLLSCLDRMPSNDFKFTHELIASMVGVRRESISEAASALQAAGMIHYHHGHISVRDPARLAARACECHAVMKSEFDRLLGPQPAAGKAVPFRPDWQRAAARPAIPEFT